MMIPAEWFAKMTGLPAPLFEKLLATIVALLLIGVLRRIILRAVWRQTTNPASRYQWNKVSNYIAFSLTILFVGRIWIEEFQSVTTFLGIVSAGLAIALKDPLVNVAGWFFIVWRRPFGVGDRIQIGNYAGDVIDLRVFQFSVMEIGNWVHADQSTGRIIHIPNGKVFVDPQINYTKGWFDYIWNEVAVLVTFESDWQKAKAILQDIATQNSAELIPLAQKKMHDSSKEFIVISPALEAAVFTSVEASGVLLTLRHLCEPRHRRESTEKVWEAILEAFAGCDDIDFAYPTQRFYNNPQEGKRGADLRTES